MLIVTIALFTLAALLGIYLLTYILQNKNTPKGVVFTHGSIAAFALFILIIYVLLYRPSPIISMIIFILAAVGGLTLIYRDLTGKSIPKWLAIGHGLTAITAFLFLLYFYFFKLI